MDEGRIVTLPMPWTAHFSKKRNLVFYFNRVTGESVWSPPKGANIGGVVHEQQNREIDWSLSNSDRVPPRDVDTTPSNIKNNGAREFLTNASTSCSRTTIIPEIGSTVPHSRSSVGSGSETVSSSIAKKRKSDEHFPCILPKQKFKDNEVRDSSATPVPHTAKTQIKHDRTPAASRLEKLQNLLQELREKKTSGRNSSSCSTSTSSEKISGGGLDLDRKRSRVRYNSPGKRQRLEVSDTDTSNTFRTNLDTQASCAVTSTTVSSSTSRIPDYVSSDDENSPESPKPGEKLPYLDSDTDNTYEAEDNVISSASKIPQKNFVRTETNEKYDNIRRNVGCKTEAVPLVSSRKELIYNEQISVNCTPNARVSVQSRLTTASTDKSNFQGNVANITNEALVSPHKDLVLSKSADTNFISNASVSLHDRLSTAASEKGCRQTVIGITEGRPVTEEGKRFTDELISGESALNASVSVQSRIITVASEKANNQSNEKNETEEKSPVRPVKHFISSKLPCERYEPYTRVSVQSRLSIAVSGKASFTGAQTTPMIPSRINILYPNIDDANTSTFHHSRTEVNDDNSSAIAKFRESIAALTSGNIEKDNSRAVSKSHVHGETKLRQSELETFDRFPAGHSTGYDSVVSNLGDSQSFTNAQNTPVFSSRINMLHSNSDDKKTTTINLSTPDVSDDSLLAIAKFRARVAALPPDKMVDSTNYVSAGYDSLATKPSETAAATTFAEDENMDVDMAFSGSPENKSLKDIASVASGNSDKPVTKPDCTDDLKKWLHQCEPSSPVANHNLFFDEEPSDDDESEEAMEWEDIDDDLSQVVSVLPKKTANADEWFIVVDTNILLHKLTIVEELRDTPFPKLGLPVLVIPWLVLQELDSLKTQRIKHKSKDPALGSRARWAVQFLNNNLKKCHPRVRGQTAQESEVEHYKRQGADDGILQCCLQLKEKGNLAVILTNDKNLANKAIVSGISSFTDDEIIAKLHELDLQLQVPKSQNQSAGAAASSGTVSRLFTNDQTDLEKTKVDLVFCHMKLLLKDLFSEVLMSGMKKLYGENWQSRTIRKPPWTLTDVVYCIIKHWDVMKEYEFKRNNWFTRDEKFKSCAKDVKKYMSNLQTFLKNNSQKCFSYDSTDLKAIINWSIDVCIGMTADSFKEKVIETINKLEVLRDVCKEKSRETVMSMLSDIQVSSSPTADSPTMKTDKAQLKYVRGKFIEAWTLMANVIGSLCDKLEIKHNIEYEVKYEFENADHICNKTAHIWPHLKALNRCFQILEITPLEDLSENHQVITDIYFNLKNIYFDCEQDVDDTFSPQLVYKYLTHPKGWKRILHIKEEFEKYEEYLMMGIVLVSEKYPDFAMNVPSGKQAVNSVQ